MKAALPFLVLIAMGAAWGGTQPLTKVAVSDGYQHYGLIFWQTVLTAVILGALTLLQRRSLPWHGPAVRVYMIIALLGAVLPGIASYQAAVHLPAGVLSILLSAIPMVSLPIAVALGTDRFSLMRLGGLLLGFGGVAVLVLPKASLPEGVQTLWIGVALIASICYALEGNIVAKWGTAGLGPVQVLTGASVVGAVVSAPVALVTGQFIVPAFPLGLPDKAMLATAILHAGAYTGYVWLVGRAGAVFTAQVSYFVTLFGICWAMLFLGEAYSGWVWTALVLLLAGMALVQPRGAAAETTQPVTRASDV